MRLRIMLPLVLVLLSLVVAGCFQSSKPKYGDVTGVIYVKEGANRAGIDVSLAGKQTKTTSEGTFSFEEIEYGKHTIVFSEEDETVHSETISVSGAINFVEINFPGVLRPDNASFEDNDGAAPAEWTSNREFGSAIISVSDDYASDGDYSLKIDGSEVNGSAWFRSAMLPVSPGDHLTGRIDVYVEKSTSGNDSNHPILYFEFRNASGIRLEEGGLVGEAISDTEGEWERVVVEGVVPQGVSYVTLWVYTGTNYDGLTYWDNATVEYATAL